MAFCPNCGSQATGGFCPNCGTPLGSASSTAGTGYSSSTTVVGSGLTDNLAGALCYTPFFIGIVASIIFLVISPYNRNRLVRFHAFQSLFLHLALFVVSIAFSIFLAVFAFATHGLGFVLGGLYPLFSVAIFVLFIVMMFQTYKNQKMKLPVIGDLAEKQA